MIKKHSQSSEHRQYVRLKSIFPVDFALFDADATVQPLNWEQGYTCNVSGGGLCLETSKIADNVLSILKKRTLVKLRVHILLSKKPIEAVAEVRWYKKSDYHGADKYVIGLHYTQIDSSALSLMLRRVKWMRISPKAAILTAAVALCFFVGSIVNNAFLKNKNQSLVNAIVIMQQEEIDVSDEINKIIVAKQLMKNSLSQKGIKPETKARLETRYEALLDREIIVKDKLAIVSREKTGLQEDVVETMHTWMKNHQSVSTGLVLSFEGNVGIVKDWAFIYDQALAVCVFLAFDNIENAKKIVNFFQREMDEDFKGFPNGYFYDSGKICEHTRHCGPNIWMGIAVLQYINKTGDMYYMPLAKKITDWLITVQDTDPAGGLKGGPDFSWFATEHNLDAYALYDIIFSMTGEAKYKTAREKVLSWLTKYAMVPYSDGYEIPPINRGVGDSTIATDTYAWSLAAIGPEKLKEIGMDPEDIMQFADDYCSVSISYERPSGAIVKAKGFDFSKEANTPRGGLISPEWTSQMIISYKMLSKYSEEQNDTLRAEYYLEKSKFYLNELNKLIISSPSPRGQGQGCLPYATLANVDTGHGWNTPHGSSTCSIAGTAYMILAIKDYNPLMLQDK